MQKINKTTILWVCAVIGFIFTLYLVEASSFSSAEVAVHNGGYGTFDMKKYNDSSVKEVLADTDTECIHAYHKYYFADFIFIIFFGLIQCMISNAVYKQNKTIFRGIAIGVPIARGVFDVIENVLLLITINSYPQVKSGVIAVASTATQCKLWCIRIWVVLVLAGVIYNICKKIKKDFYRSITLQR